MVELHVPPSELGIDLTQPTQFFKWTQILAYMKKKEQDAMEKNRQDHGTNSGPKITFEDITEMIKNCPQPPPPQETNR